MRTEARTLLELIGTDIEISRLDASKIYLLADSIELGKDLYGLFKGCGFNREDYRMALMELVPFFGQMSDPAFSRLMDFSDRLGFHLDREVGELIKERINDVLPPYSEEQLGKRSTFIQAFEDLQPPLYTYEELEREEEVREKYPWRWIGAVMSVNPERAKEYIVNQICLTQNIRPFRPAIYHLVRKMPAEYLDTIIEQISGKIPEQLVEELRDDVITYRSNEEKLHRIAEENKRREEK